MQLIFAQWHLLSLHCRILLNYDNANDILKYVCIVYKPKIYKLFCLSVMIGSEPLKFVNETKYLDFTFCNLNKDGKDMIKQ